MELPTLLTSDLHLTDNPADDYRWKLFDFLADRCQAEGVKTLGILGDLTDAKDYHPSRLTNRIVEQIVRMRALVDEVIILEGNHDYLRKGHAYFEFLNHLPGIRFIVKPYEDLTGSKAGLWLPHTKTPMQDWKDWDFTHYNYVFMHQTAPGSIASNGQAMDGDALPDFGESKIYSGDIHVPRSLEASNMLEAPTMCITGTTSTLDAFFSIGAAGQWTCTSIPFVDFPSRSDPSKSCAEWISSGGIISSSHLNYPRQTSTHGQRSSARLRKRWPTMESCSMT